MPEFLTGPLEQAVLQFCNPDSTWRTVQPWRRTDACRGSSFLQHDEKPWGTCRITRNSRVLAMHFDHAQIEQVLFDWDREMGFVRFGLYSAGILLQPGESFTVIQEWTCE
jgi:hypothetical protein